MREGEKQNTHIENNTDIIPWMRAWLVKTGDNLCIIHSKGGASMLQLFSSMSK